jgi:hypothetical protein
MISILDWRESIWLLKTYAPSIKKSIFLIVNKMKKKLHVHLNNIFTVLRKETSNFIFFYIEQTTSHFFMERLYAHTVACEDVHAEFCLVFLICQNASKMTSK